MAKAIRFGVAAGLALTASAPAWAGDEKAEEKAARGEATTSERASADRSKPTGDKGAGAEAGMGSRSPEAATVVKASYDVKASRNERWLQEREGYRDGGY
jgi:hypothetical protein